MKNKLFFNSVFLKTVLLITCFLLAILINKSKAITSTPHSAISTKIAVNFKHDIEKNELTVSIQSATKAIMQLFFFTPDGILIQEVAVSAHKITTVKGLKKGLYLYECFDNDERMKSGSLLIK